MWKLFVAVFFSVATVGFFVDLVDWGLLSIPETLGWVTLVGGFAVAVVIVSSKRRKLIPFVVIVYISTVFVLAFRHHAPKLAPLPHAARERIIFDAVGMLAGSMIGYFFFMAFVNSEGVEMLALQTELELAHRLQRTLGPPIELNTGNFELYGRTIPSKNVGGDLVDGFEACEAITAYVADVSGHGIPAGTLMGMIKMAVRMFSIESNQPINPGDLLAALNRALPFVKEPNMYATAACVTAHKDGYASFSTAGHGPIFHYSAGTGQVSCLHIEQFPLGLFPSEYTAQKSILATGDLLVICTDGILEAENTTGKEFGAIELQRILAESARESPAKIFDRIMEAVYRHCPKPPDDCSLLIFRYKHADEDRPAVDSSGGLLSLKAGLENRL